MLLSDVDLHSALASRALQVDPMRSDAVQPSSIDMRLGPEFLTMDRYSYKMIDPSSDQPTMFRKVTPAPGDPVVLRPGEFVLASTFERVTLNRTLAARLEGKSSIGRLGLLVHATAGFIDPGFSGTVTLELSNVAPLPIVLWPGMRIGQLCVFALSSPAAEEYGSARYNSRYQGQDGPTPSRSHIGFVHGLPDRVSASDSSMS